MPTPKKKTAYASKINAVACDKSCLNVSLFVLSKNSVIGNMTSYSGIDVFFCANRSCFSIYLNSENPSTLASHKTARLLTSIHALGSPTDESSFFRPVRDDLKHTLKLIAPMYSTAGFFQVQTFTNHPLLPFYQSLQIIAPFKGLKKGFAARQSFFG